jgi:hypothetical protein
MDGGTGANRSAVPPGQGILWCCSCQAGVPSGQGGHERFIDYRANTTKIIFISKDASKSVKESVF